MSPTIQAVPPGPTSRIPGGLLWPFRKDPIAFLRSVAAYGPIARFCIGPQQVFVLTQPEYIREVLVAQNRKFVKGGALQRARGILGDGLLTSEGDYHLRQRRLAQPAFHRQRIAGYAGVMAEFAARVRDRWQPGQELDLASEMMHLTLAIVGKTLFGADVEREAAEIEESINALYGLFDTLMLPFYELLQKLPTATNRRAAQALKRLDATIYRMIAERRASGEDTGDLLSMLLLAQDTEGDGTGMSDKQVRDEAMTLFLAGHETTANALTWCFYVLTQHPEVAERLVAEVEEVLGDRLPTMEDLPKLAYTERVLAESMRLYPPGWAIGRKAVAEAEIGGYTIPKGALVLMSQLIMHHHPDYFPDPERFDPDRFLPEARAGRPHFAYFPFGGGPRGCIGEPFAWMEGVIVLAVVARRWRMRLVEGHPVELQPLVTLRPRYGMRMVVEPRA